tara:strand:- start:236 stop:1153 length:918 start_codon:yes stop_codon:yes gene_type:complete
MKQPILSIVIPTRDNIEVLRDGFLKSFIHNTSDVNNVELIFVVDKDDKKTIDFISNEKLLKRLAFFQLLIRERSINLTEDYYNYGARKSSSFFVMPGADDIQIDTPDYDLILIKTREGLIKSEGLNKKHYLLIRTYGEGNKGGEGYCCFPILTKASVDLLGYFLAPSTIPGWGADYHIDKIYNTLNRIAATKPVINITQWSCHSNLKEPSARDRENYNRMVNIINPSGLNCREHPRLVLEILTAIHSIVTETMENYTPPDLWKAYESARVINESVKGAAPGTRCPDIFLKILWSIQQTLHDNLNT